MAINPSLNLCRNCIIDLANAVQRGRRYKKEVDAFAAGKRLRTKMASWEEVRRIVRWKSPRSMNHFAKKTDDEYLRTILQKVDAATSPADQMSRLVEIDGVGPGIASAILAAMYPTSHTVIDIRALDALGLAAYTNFETIYPEYLAFCRSKAEELDVELRTLDQALWKAGAI